MDDDITLPRQVYTDDPDTEILNELEGALLESQSKYPLHIQVDPQKVTEQDILDLSLDSELQKKMLISELADCELYLKNIHRGFKFASSTRSLINLVGAGLGVHKHRRQILKELNEGKKKTLTFNEYGEVES